MPSEKCYAAVLAVLCFLPISAQAEHVVKVGRGLIFIPGAINPNLFDVSFAGGRFRITQLGVDDFTVTPGLHQCTPCSSSMFVPGVELTQFSPPGSGWMEWRLKFHCWLGHTELRLLGVADDQRRS